MVVQLARISSDLSLADFNPPPASGPLPLAVCWLIWIVASAGLWFIALRAVAWLF